MADDLAQRISTFISKLHRRGLELAHPNQNEDMAQIFFALALILEAQRDLALEQSRILGRLDHQ
jgi:hypothetical protein